MTPAEHAFYTDQHRRKLKTDARGSLSAEQVRELLYYDSETGALFWKRRSGDDRTTKSWNTRYAGLRADKARKKDGYRQIGVFGKNYLAHRVVWAYLHGKWPDDLIDHINGVRDDNRAANLRESNDRLNNENIRKKRVDNKSGYLGVHFDKKAKRFRSQIRHNRIAIVIGYFDDPKEAHKAYLVAKRRIHKGCTI